MWKLVNKRLRDYERKKLRTIAFSGEGSRITSTRAVVVLIAIYIPSIWLISKIVGKSRRTVSRVISQFNRERFESLPSKHSSRPRKRTFTEEDRALVVATVFIPPHKFGMEYKTWSLRKLAEYLSSEEGPLEKSISHEKVREILRSAGLTHQKIKTWKESNDPKFKQKVKKIDRLLKNKPRNSEVIAFDELSNLECRPHPGSGWFPSGKPDLHDAEYRRTEGTFNLLGFYNYHRRQLWGYFRRRKRAVDFLEVLKMLRKRYPISRRIYLILDNLSSHKAKIIRTFCEENNMILAFTPTKASHLNPIEEEFGVIKEYALKGQYYRTHTQQNKAIRKALTRRNKELKGTEGKRAAGKHRYRARTRVRRR